MARTTSHLAPAVAVISVGFAILMGAAPAAAESPWKLLEDLRKGLVDSGPITGNFKQTYVPAGFETGDTESGDLSMWLPTCLRWNYVEPEKKHFLLCESEVWSWNDLEPSGNRYRIEPEQEPGLDLLLVDVAKLRERYVADSERQADGTYLLHLETPPDAPTRFKAEIRIDPVEDRVLGLEYTDGEGNRTRFEISGYQNLAHTGLFKAPNDLEWNDG
ncbi:MAG: outer membrane lipoprotein carrier protein LolA [Acidobacteriota bacterium]